MFEGGGATSNFRGLFCALDHSFEWGGHPASSFPVSAEPHPHGLSPQANPCWEHEATVAELTARLEAAQQAAAEEAESRASLPGDWHFMAMPSFFVALHVLILSWDTGNVCRWTEFEG